MIKRFFILYLVFSLIFPINSFAKSPSKETVAIVPASSSNTEIQAINKEIADALTLKLRDYYNIPSQKTVSRILKQLPKTVSKNVVGDVKAIQYIKNSRSAFATGKKQLALNEIDNAIQYLSKGVTPSVQNSRLLITSKLNKAWYHYKAKSKDLAKNELQSIFLLDKDFKIFGFPNSFKRFVLDQKKNMVSYSSGIKIASKPESVEFAINGVLVGSTPSTVDLPKGEYAVTFFADNRKAVTKQVKVSDNRYKKVKASLKWQGSKNKSGTFPIFASKSHGNNLAKANQFAAKTGALKTAFVDVQKVGEKYKPKLYIFDHKYNQAYQPVEFKATSDISRISSKMIDRFSMVLKPVFNRGSDKIYRGDLPSDSILDQRVAMRPKKPLHKKPAFWAGVGGVIVTGVVLGLILSSGGGDSGSGSVGVGFDGFR